MAATIKDRILAEIRDDEVIRFAKDLCAIPSFTTEETRVARFLDKVFRDAGFESELQEVEPGRFQTVARLRGGGGGQSLMLNGHIDIDPLAAGWAGRDPWTAEIDGDRFIAGGIYNMKAGDTAMIMAALAARRAGVPLRGDVVVACVVGELQGGVGTKHLLDRGLRTDLAIVPEPYGTDHVITKHTGVMHVGVHVKGRSLHVMRQKEGVNAIVKMARLIEALDGIDFTFEVDPDLPDLPLSNVGTILGGRGEHWEIRGPYMHPDRCLVVFDVRFNRSMTQASVLADIRRALDRVAATDPEIDYTLESPVTSLPGMAKVIMNPLSVETDHPLVRAVVANARALTGAAPTVGALAPYSYAGNDTSHLYEAGIPCLLYGPGGGAMAEGAIRWTSVTQMLACTRVLGATIADLCA